MKGNIYIWNKAQRDIQKNNYPEKFIKIHQEMTEKLRVTTKKKKNIEEGETVENQ